MDDFERRLKQVSLRAPSEELDERVLSGVRVRRVESGRWVRRPIPAWAALAASLLMVLLGFAGGTLWITRRPITVVQARPAAVEMRVIYTDSPRNPFDCTQVSQDFLSEPMKVQVHVEGGV